MTNLKSIPGYVDVWDNYDSDLNRKRWNLLLEFIKLSPEGKILDIGERNPFTEILEQHFKRRIENTGLLDLDTEKLQGSYKTIFCFEVIEHLMNPLFFMRNCLEILEDESKMYISTPLRKPEVLRDNETHFNEYRPKELHRLFNKAGFKINRLRIVRHIPSSWLFKGIRPALRYLFFGRNIQVELNKKFSN
ncbi:MAG: methyltransferase domain-containing protein [bacterium]